MRGDRDVADVAARAARRAVGRIAAGIAAVAGIEFGAGANEAIGADRLHFAAFAAAAARAGGAAVARLDNELLAE